MQLKYKLRNMDPESVKRFEQNKKKLGEEDAKKILKTESMHSVLNYLLINKHMFIGRGEEKYFYCSCGERVRQSATTHVYHNGQDREIFVCHYCMCKAFRLFDEYKPKSERSEIQKRKLRMFKMVESRLSMDWLNYSNSF